MKNKIEERMLLIDGNFLMFQSFYASYNPYYPENVMTAPNGVTTNGVHVFMQTLFKLLKFANPKYLFIAFDAHGKTKRHEEFEGYKAGRVKAPVIIFEQFAAIKEILSALNIKWFEKVGDEADDLIATLAFHNNTCPNWIFSKDKDLLQLVDENTNIIKVQKDYDSYNSYELETIDNFKDIYGINPEQIPDYKGLAGDSSDNLKGVQGIGPKKAVTLLNEYNTLENIYDHLSEIKGKTKEYLEKDKEQAMFCKKLAILNKNVNMNLKMENYILSLNDQEASDVFTKYGLHNVADLYFDNWLPIYGKKN